MFQNHIAQLAMLLFYRAYSNRNIRDIYSDSEALRQMLGVIDLTMHNFLYLFY